VFDPDDRHTRIVRLKVDSSINSTTALMILIWQLNKIILRKDLYSTCNDSLCVLLATASKVVMQAADLEYDPPITGSDVDSTLITGAMCWG
jgi:hypothetical protein